MPRRTLTDCRAIVTGASEGIGRALVLELARHKVRIVAVARREHLLREVVQEACALGTQACYVAGDITDPDVRRAVMHKAKQEYNGADILVNNAGVGAVGLFQEAQETRLRRIMEVNFFASAEMIRQAVPLLREGRQPLVVNISSVLGHRGMPKTSEYCASKFALQGLSEALRSEFYPLGIDLLVVSPSTTETGFFDNLLDKQGETGWQNRPKSSAEKVARRIVKAMQRNKREIFIGWTGKLLLWANRLFPRILDSLIARFG